MSEKILSTQGGASSAPAFLFDLDGTLVDSVYQHVLAWREALERAGISLSVWRIHRRIGMSGGLLSTPCCARWAARSRRSRASGCASYHAEEYARLVGQVRPLPGARELLEYLTRAGVPWAIATSGWRESAQPALDMLGVGPDVPIITRDQVRYAKPDPDLFLAAAEGLGVSIESSVVVGDSVWDLLAARRARALGVGLLSGGYGEDELMRAGAYRVYQDPADLLEHLDEVGVRLPIAMSPGTKRPVPVRSVQHELGGAVSQIRRRRRSTGRRCAVARSRRNPSTAIAARTSAPGDSGAGSPASRG